MILLEDIHTEYGRIQIIESKHDGIRTYYQEKCFHSQANAEGVSTTAYVHVMYNIIRQSGAKDVLMIGGAGGTLATMLSRLGCKVTVLDINPHAFDIARKYFYMPPEVECIVGDGYAYLLETGSRYDAIAVDAFDSEGFVPQQFVVRDFFALAKEVLNPTGVMVMNVMVDHDLDLLADSIAQNMEAAHLPATLFDWVGRPNRNTLVACGQIDHLHITPDDKPSFIRKEMHGLARRGVRRVR